MNIILTGATGMVGEGVLIEALSSPEIDQVLVLGRRSCGVEHPKLKELVHSDLFDLSPIAEQLSGYSGCLFCLGTTSIGKSEDSYRKVTYDLTMSIAKTLAKKNPQMTFC